MPPNPFRVTPRPVPGPNVRRVRSELLTWYGRHRRDLPWRRTRDPYAIWVSEVMLQQTRVDTVIPYFERFLARWPTVQTLADANPDDVRAAWSGLGYYRRARLMMDAARMLVQEHEGRLPADEASLATLPGFGAYTTGAVAAIAFDRPVPAIDGNVTRVISRLWGLAGDATSSSHRRTVKAIVSDLMPGSEPGNLAQALMELGATVCTPRNSGCETCPVKAECRARRDGTVDGIPPPRKRPKPRIVRLTALVISSRTGEVWLERRPENGLFGGLWCPPLIDGHRTPAELQDHALAPSLTGMDVVGERIHRLTHRELVVRVVSARTIETGSLSGLSALSVDSLRREAIPSFTAKLLLAGLPASLRARARLPGRGSAKAAPKRM